jgi:trigger factor
MTRLRREVGEQLIAAYSHVEMPPRLVENEARAMVQQTVEQAKRNGQAVQVPADAHEGFKDAARKRVLVGLLVGEVARSNQLRLDPKRLNETLRLIASTYEEPEQVIELYRNDPQLMSGLQNRVMEEQVIDWIAERAQHTEQALSFQEAIRQ